MTAKSITVLCPAKVNLALLVGPPRSTDGLHPLASWMVATTFGDRLELHQSEADQPSQFDIAFDPVPSIGGELITPHEVDWPLDKDLVYRAHRGLEEHLGRSLPIQATLKKHIPPGAGLGGGSSDAAGMLIALNQLFDLKLRQPLLDIAATLGSDVPFLVEAMWGQTSAMVTGVGETIQPIRLNHSIPLVLVFPEFGCETGAVYRKFDELNPEAVAPDPDKVLRLAALNPLPQNGPFNDLAKPAIAVQPKLGEYIETLRQRHIEAHVTGSGSTLFAIAPSRMSSHALARSITEITGLRAVATETM